MTGDVDRGTPKMFASAKFWGIIDGRTRQKGFHENRIIK